MGAREKRVEICLHNAPEYEKKFFHLFLTVKVCNLIFNKLVFVELIHCFYRWVYFVIQVDLILDLIDLAIWLLLLTRDASFPIPTFIVWVITSYIRILQQQQLLNWKLSRTKCAPGALSLLPPPPLYLNRWPRVLTLNSVVVCLLVPFDALCLI